MIARAALLVVDMQVDVFERHPTLNAQRARLVAATNALTNAMRLAGVPVIWIRPLLHDDSNASWFVLRRIGLSVNVAGSAGATLLPELIQGTRDHTVIRKQNSALLNSGLDALLESLDVRQLILAGIHTDAGLRAMADEAERRELRVVIAADCLHSTDTNHNDGATRDLGTATARPMTNAEIVALVSDR